MRRSLLRLSLFLYLFSMILPLEMTDGGALLRDYTPGLAALFFGFFSIGMIGENPLLFLAWTTNFLLIAGYIRGLGFRNSCRILAIVSVVLSAPMLFSLEFQDPVSSFSSPAFLVWFSSILMFLVAEFTPGQKVLKRMNSHLQVNGRFRPLHTVEDLVQLALDKDANDHAEFHLQGKDDSAVKVHFNNHYAYATYIRHKGDPGIMSQGNLSILPETQVFQSRKFGFRQFPGLYLLTHTQGINILTHFAKTGGPEPSIQWSSDEDLATELNISIYDVHAEL